MICLTSDIHHSSLKTEDQKSLRNCSEAEIALDFLKLCSQNNVKLTYFLTGKLILEEFEVVKKYLKFANVRFGGHTFNAFQPELLHRVYKKLLGSYNGPYWYQARDVRKTCDIFRKYMGIDVEVWRNHAYFNDANTLRILHENGISILSDGTSQNAERPLLSKEGVFQFPINILPDHEHLYHADRNPKSVTRWVKRYSWSDAFTHESYDIGQWSNIIKNQIRDREKRKQTSLLIIHPICLYLCDETKSWMSLLEFLRGYETVFLKDTVGLNKPT